MKAFLKFLLILLIVALISAVVIGIYLYLERPLIEAAIVIGVILGLWLAFVLIRKLIIRYRARAQVQRVLQQEQALAVDEQTRLTPRELLRDLRKRWRKTIGTLRRSQLKFRGDPLYVLPWFMVIGRPTSGKSTALKNARLLLPEIDLPRQGDGSTVNMDWWLYEQAIVIDTAGRYVVPEETKRDRREWGTLLEMLARHKQKEPLNGLIVVVAASRLLEASEEDLLEEGRQVRASMNELMERLEAHVPVYLMVTKCDLVPGFADWCQYLPQEARNQAMGYLHMAQGGDLDAILDRGLDAVLDRMKEVRLLMLERSQNPGDSLLRLPTEMGRLRKGLHTFAKTALKENPYQDTPKFRGLFFSSSQQQVAEEDNDKPGVRNQGLFLHEFFTRILPADRGLLDSLPSAARIRRAARNWALSIGGGATVLALLLLTLIFTKDRNELVEIVQSFDEISLSEVDINDRVAALNQLRELILVTAEAESAWVVPWTGEYGRSDQLQELIELYTQQFEAQVLARLDDNLRRRIVELQGQGTSDLAGGLIRRVNLLNARIAGTTGADLADKPPVLRGYLRLIDGEFSGEAADLFNDLYLAYLDWHSSPLVLDAEKKSLQEAFLLLIERNHGDYSWMIDWANSQINEPVTLSEFWSGSRSTTDEPTVASAYTLVGYEFIQNFLQELEEANAGDDRLANIREDFDVFYERRYFRAWDEFVTRFDEGWGKFRDRREWLRSIERFVVNENPYFSLMQRLNAETAPFENPEGLTYSTEVEFFNDMLAFGGDGEGGGADAGKAAKLGLKLLGKTGKAGKAIAGVGKKGLKTAKKVQKIAGKSKEDLDAVLEDAAKTLDEYRKALADAAFDAESLTQSFNTTQVLFTTPENPGSGDGAPSRAWNAIVNLQRLMGKPLPSNQAFWKLYAGPLRQTFEFMRRDTGCYLQEQWESGVIAELEGVTRNKIGNTLIGEQGLLWSYVDTQASAFLSRRRALGYLPAQVDGRSIPWRPEFLDFVNRANVGRSIVGGEFTVRINALPTGVNLEAAISPYATFLQMHCADGVQSLSNYNYATGQDFIWSLEKCGDVSLSIEVGHVALRKNYSGVKGFPEFLSEFRDGRRIFVAGEFPDQAAQLRNENVNAIDVNYEIFGQEPVIRMIDSVPLDPPSTVAACWQ